MCHRAITVLLTIFILQATASLISNKWTNSGFLTCAIINCFVPISYMNPYCNALACQCGNGTFATIVAECVGGSCPNDVSSTYSLYQAACTKFGYQISTDQDDFSNAAASASSKPRGTAGISGSTAQFIYASYSRYPECTADLCIAPLTYKMGNCSDQGNSCTCRDRPFLTAWGACTREKCKADFHATYSTAQENCAAQGYALGITWGDFTGESGSENGASSNTPLPDPTPAEFTPAGSTQAGSTPVNSTPARSTPASSTTATASSSGNGGGLSKNDQISLGVGIASLVVTIMGLWIAWRYRNRRHRRAEIRNAIDTGVS